MNRKYLAIPVLLALLAIAAFTLSSQYGASRGDVVYVAITVDTERDYPPYMDTYRGIDEGLPRLLGLLDAHDVSATFFVTGNVARERPGVVSALSQGHEIGCHSMYHQEALYALPDAMLKARILVTTALLEAITRENIVSFRSPYHSGSTALMHILESLGYTTEGSATKLSSYPYHPSPDEWVLEGDMKILRVPVSNGPYHLYTFFYSGGTLIDAYEYVLADQEGRDVKLVVVGFHPWEFCDMETGHERWDRICGDTTYDMLSELLDYLDTQNVEYVTYHEIPALFE